MDVSVRDVHRADLRAVAPVSTQRTRMTESRPGRFSALICAVSALLLIIVGGAAPAYADDAVVDGVTYDLVDENDPAQGVIAVDYDADDNPTHPALVLPSSVDVDGEMVPVVEVGYEAFQSAGLASVVVPGSVAKIDMFAFDDNPSLTDVELNDGLGWISNLAFRDAALTVIDIPDTVWRIDFQALRGNSLEAVELPAGLTRMGGGVFFDNPSLARVRFNGPLPELLFAVGNPIGATDPATDPVIEYLWRYGQDQVPEGTDGYTAPQMWDYSSVAIAEVTFLDWDASVHATRFVPLDQAGDDGLWGAVEVDELPVDPVRSDHEFALWLDQSRNMTWAPGVVISPVIGDTRLSSAWVDLLWVSSVVLTATPAEAVAGEPVTLTAEGFNTRGNSVGDVTDDIIFDAPGDNSFLLDGNQVTFAEAGTYTVTGVHSVTELPVSVEIEVRAAPTVVPAGEDEGSITTEREQRQTLPAAGTQITPWAGVAGALALLLGTGLLIVNRRKSAAREGAA